MKSVSYPIVSYHKSWDIVPQYVEGDVPYSNEQQREAFKIEAEWQAKGFKKVSLHVAMCHKCKVGEWCGARAALNWKCKLRRECRMSQHIRMHVYGSSCVCAYGKSGCDSCLNPILACKTCSSGLFCDIVYGMIYDDYRNVPDDDRYDYYFCSEDCVSDSDSDSDS